MKKLIRVKLAGNLLLISLGVLIIFHILVIMKIVPSEIVWGGQIQDSASNLFMLEMIALVVTSVFGVIVAAKMGYIQAGKLNIGVNIGIWILFAYLVLNFVGNLASGVSFENLFFAPLTLILALCAFRLAIEK